MEREEALAAVRADHSGGAARVGRAVRFEDDAERLEDDARALAGEQLEAERARGLLRAANGEHVEDVVEIDGRDLADRGRERGGGLHLEEALEPAFGDGGRALRRAFAGGARGGVEVDGEVRAEAADALGERRGDLEKGCPVRRAAIVEEGRSEREARVGALVAGEDLERGLVGVDGEQRIEARRGGGLAGELAIDEGLLRFPHAGAGALSLGEEVSEVRRAILALVAEIAVAHGEERGERVAEERGILHQARERGGLCPGGGGARGVERDADVGARAIEGDVAGAGVAEGDRAGRGCGHDGTSEPEALAAGWDARTSARRARRRER